MAEQGPFTMTPANAPFAILPGLVLMFTLAPAATPTIALPISALFFGFIGAIVGLVTYRFVADRGTALRLLVLTALCVLLGGLSLLLVAAGQGG